jgi:hypothetical protein
MEGINYPGVYRMIVDLDDPTILQGLPDNVWSTLTAGVLCIPDMRITLEFVTYLDWLEDRGTFVDDLPGDRAFINIKQAAEGAGVEVFTLTELVKLNDHITLGSTFKEAFALMRPLTGKPEYVRRIETPDVWAWLNTHFRAAWESESLYPSDAMARTQAGEVSIGSGGDVEKITEW